MKLRHLAFCCLLLCPLAAQADLRIYDFDDGTLQDWQYVTINDEPYPIEDENSVHWIVSDQDIDLGEAGWKLLQGTSVNGIGAPGSPQREPNFRIIPDPWGNRDCLGTLQCPTQMLKSPTFMLDASGPISVDMMGGQAADGRNFDPEVDTPPEFPMDFDEFRSSDGWQGYALYDIADDQYVRWGFPTFTNDGKEKDGRDVWERVTIPAEELAELANDGKEYRLDIFDAYLGGWGWIGLDTVQIPDLAFTASAPAFDCNGDNITDLSDLACVASIADRDTVLGELGSLPGDFDGDGSVGFPDFLVLSANFGSESGSYLEGNIDLSAGVGFPDFLILSANFGQTAAAASASAVPEPSTGALGLLGLLALMCVRRSRK